MVLVDLAGVCPLPDGYQVIVRADWTDRTLNVPHGLSYAIILQDSKGNKVVGYDNSHGYDGGGTDEPFDHEHRWGRVGQRFKYDFKSASRLVSDFAGRCSVACERLNIPFEFDETGCQS
jgi:hypothetical protein